MAAYAALVSLMCNIEKMMSHPYLSTCFDNNQIQPLHEKAAFLLDFIESHHNYCGGEAQDLERRVASAAHAAEDVIESHIVDQILAEEERKKKANEEGKKKANVQKMIQIENSERRTTGSAHAAEDVIESHIVDQILAGPPDVQKKIANDPLMKMKMKMKMMEMKMKMKKMKMNWERRPTGSAHAAEDVDPICTTLCTADEDEDKDKDEDEDEDEDEDKDVDPISITHAANQFDAGSNQASLGCSLDLQQIIQDMNAIVEKANELKEKEALSLSKEQQLTETGEVTTAAMVGFEDELIQLLDELTNQQSSRRIISIMGMGGTGKTTLAQNVYANPLIIEHFDIRAWATVSQQYNVQEILAQLLYEKGKSSDKKVNELGEHLHKTLFGRRYLIILDDIWSVEAWDQVRRFFPENGNGSQIVLTTRLSNVANDCGSSCLSKHLLDESESWELFCKKAFPHEDCPPQLEEVGKEIVKLCKGLPLSIVVIGGSLLKSPRDVAYWKNVATNIKSNPNSTEKQESLDVLLSSYNHLPPCLKPCFLHIGVFKSCFSTIRVPDIIKLWVAEGFIKPNGGRVLEEIAEDYLKDLVDRNLILVGTRGKNGKMKSCDIHDLLRDLCLKVSEQQEFYHVRGSVRGSLRGTERRLIYGSVRFASEDTPLARSIMAYEFSYFHKYRLLRLLDVRHGHWLVEKLISENVNLRYLAMRHTSSRLDLKLPTSVSLVWNLQTLNFRNYGNTRVVAPIEIWKMRQLRHIECHEIYLPHPSPSNEQNDVPVLENLQTLRNAVSFKLSEDVCNIIPNIKILHLAYDRKFPGLDDCLIKCLSNLVRLHKLESLKVRADRQWPSGELNKILAFPNSLNKLSLTYCGLHWEDMAVIGSLPHLEVLKLELYSFTKGEQWNPVDGQFLRLKFLKINCCKLMRWNANSSHFPVLQKLVLHGLSKLEGIPRDIGEIPTLQLIHVNDCSFTAMISALQIKEDRLEYEENDDLQIQVIVRDHKRESFMEMVGTEGLTINNVQFKTRYYWELE